MIGTSGTIIFIIVCLHYRQLPTTRCKFCKAKPLRDIFLRKIPETNIYIFQAPWTSRKTQTWLAPHDLVFGPKKDETEQILRKKYAQLTRCKFLCPHRSWRSGAKRRNREITGFDHRNVIARSIFPEHGLDRTCLIFFCLSHRFHDLICYLSDRVLPSGSRQFVYGIHKSMK